ncbi:ABC transporter substrate-binding protein [Maridesulfovibrio frigidus]|uniref:ABC transporter substrate-binding protein n=1 Tax=Maridesulfovibrio frigidus TaxID=340956 RepID=UPI0004E0D90D|nr:ABC transporter substrate binding protein [Maridesulfovibrio frigidus]
MRLLKILLLQCILLCLCCAVVQAQPKKVIILETMTAPLVQDMTDSFLDHLQSLGYQSNEDYQIVRLNAEGNAENAETLLRKELEKGQPDLVVSVATYATKAAVKLLGNTNVPIVFIAVSDPIGSGIVKDVGKPTGTNITGIVFSVSEKTIIKMVLKTFSNCPKKRPLRFGVVYSGYHSAVGDARRLKEAAMDNPDIQFVFKKVAFRPGKEGEDPMLQAAAQAMRSLEGQVDFMWQPSDYMGALPQSSEVFAKASPVPIGFTRYIRSLEKGALLRIVPSIVGSGVAAAQIVDSIWHGANPDSIPVKAPPTMDIGLNLSTMKNLNLVIPIEIMEFAKDNYVK